MGHFAKVENGVVTQVIVADQGFIDTGAVGDPNSWVQTSYNTRGNVHYGQDGQPDDGQALRGNYAGIGYLYDNANDVFYPSSPFPSWLISAGTNWTWTAPVAQPEAIEGKFWAWNEETTSWVSNDIPALPQ
jgi:hypothetical protein